jgi:hypothetical protein
MASYYGIIIIYPILSTLFVKWTQQGGWVATLKNEFYLWVGFSLAFGAILFILFNTVRLTSSAGIIVFIVYTILYALLSVIRKVTITDSIDLNSKLQGN